MTWLLIYGSVAVAVLGALIVCFARALRGDAFRIVAIAAAAALWPLVALGGLQYGVVRMFAIHLSRRTAAPVPMPAEPEPVTIPMDLVDSMARFAQRLGATRPA
mgnify:CR=1 FL=1